MNFIKIFALAFVLVFISCSSDREKKLLDKENELVRKELELPKEEKENDLKSNQEQSKNTKEAKEDEFKQLEEFIPLNYKIVSTNNGKNLVIDYLNNDEFQDAAVLIASSNNNFDEATEVRIAILTGTEEGDYNLNTMSGDLTNPQIQVKNKIISVKHQSMRHDYELKFRYEEDRKQFMLIGSELNYYGEENISSNFLTKKRIIIDLNEEKQVVKLNFDLFQLSEISDINIYKIIGE